MLAKWINERKGAALLMARVALGLVFIAYGWNHVVGMGGFIDAFSQRFHIPFPELLAPLTAWAEFLGGIAVLLGAFTRYAGLALAIVMVVSTFTVKLPAGLERGGSFLGLAGAWDLDLALFALGIALLLLGPGRLSLEMALFKREL